MTKGNPEWEQFEYKVQELLDLRSTPGSGNQWHDASDGRSKPEDPYRLMVDCKHTQRPNYSLNLTTLNQWYDQASLLGFHFALPVHMVGLGAERDKTRQKEWVTVLLDDYAELVDAIRILNGPKRCGGRSPMKEKAPCCRRAGHFGHHDNGEMEWST